MGLPAKNEGGKFERDIIEADNHLAICFSVIDLGTTWEDYQGTKSLRHKIKIGWELPNLIHKYTPKDSDEEKEFVPTIYKDYTLSLNEKANLRRDLEGWRGKAFTVEEEAGFDVENLIGVPCLLNVIHKTSKSGKVYAVVASVSKLIKGMSVPELTRNTQFLSFYDEPFDLNTYHTLPAWLQDLIATSNEYKKLYRKDEYEETPTSPQPENNIADDDVPF